MLLKPKVHPRARTSVTLPRGGRKKASRTSDKPQINQKAAETKTRPFQHSIPPTLNTQLGAAAAQGTTASRRENLSRAIYRLSDIRAAIIRAPAPGFRVRGHYAIFEAPLDVIYTYMYHRTTRGGCSLYYATPRARENRERKKLRRARARCVYRKLFCELSFDKGAHTCAPSSLEESSILLFPAAARIKG